MARTPIPPRERESSSAPATHANASSSLSNIPVVADDIKLLDESQFALWYSELMNIMQAEYEVLLWKE